jgi:phosphatidate cytidylyltransferase
MSELGKRVITGILFGASVIGSIIFHPLAFALLMLMFIIVACFEWVKLLKIDVHPLHMTLFALWAFSPVLFLVLKFEELTVLAFLSFVLILPVAGIVEMFRNKEHPTSNFVGIVGGLFYFVLPFLLLTFLLQENLFKYSAEVYYYLLFFFAIIWLYDTFAYFSGMLAGKHPLWKRLSPKKTIEGAVGGFLLTMLLVYFLNPYTFLFPDSFVLIAAPLVIIAATFGDLFESLLKRKAEVKDSGTFLPGHGGVLDRFDSVFFAAPVFFLFYIVYFS